MSCKCNRCKEHGEKVNSNRIHQKKKEQEKANNVINQINDKHENEVKEENKLKRGDNYARRICMSRKLPTFN